MQVFDCSSTRRWLSFFALPGALSIFFLPLVTFAQTGAAVRIIAQNEAGQPASGVRAQLKLGGAVAASAVTDERGVAAFPNVAPGTYDVEVAKEGFETLIQDNVGVAAGAPLEVRFTLVPKIELKEGVEIKADAAGAPVEQGSSPPAALSRDQAQSLPQKATTVSDVLPMLPGVVRTHQGEIKISAASENRSAFIVNSADVTDPATGQFGMTVPVDIVRRIDVFKTPYLAQYGRFTAGVVSVETRRGGDKWKYEFNDPLPEWRILDGNLHGVRSFTPRLVVNGPVIANRLYLSEGTEYALRKTPVRTLAYPNKETKSESINSFTQLDLIVSPTHTITGTFHYAPRRDSWVGLDYFNQRPVTPNFRGRDYTGTVSDRLTLGASLLESTVTVKRYSADVWAQGDAEMNLTPTGNTGNYFSEQGRKASRVEWLETFSPRPVVSAGAHNLKFGTVLARTGNRGEFDARPVNILDEAGRRLRRIEYEGGAPYDRADTELAVFGQDHWVVTPRLALDLGTRVERQGITGTVRIAPRAGVAWTPFAAQQTVIRGGFGLFYDRVPLNVYGFESYPEQVVTTYGAGGEVIDGPRRFANITERVERSFPFIRGGETSGNFAPYSATWNAEVEHSFSPLLRVRANYLSSDSDGGVILTPKVVAGQDAMALGGEGKSRYRQLELTARVTWQEAKQQVMLSYVRSSARGDVNEFNNYLGNFPSPLVRPNQYARQGADLPHRFLAWGIFNLPWKVRFSPTVEYRNGFPFSVYDAGQGYVGAVNSGRFPNFFSLDTRLSKDFQVKPKYAVRMTFRVFNATNHFNALDVHRNVADPRFGIFFGNNPRRYLLDFDLIF